jgi:hypothetical protein
MDSICSEISKMIEAGEFILDGTKELISKMKKRDVITEMRCYGYNIEDLSNMTLVDMKYELKLLRSIV